MGQGIFLDDICNIVVKPISNSNNTLGEILIMIIIQIMLLLYSALILIASVQFIKKESKHDLIIYANLFFTVIIIVLDYFMGILIVKWIITFSLVGMQITAMLNGKHQNNFHLSHHVTRMIITIIFITFMFY